MDPHDLRDFAQRDWARLERAKLEHWRDELERRGALPLVRAADALRVHVQDFADQAPLQERATDLAHHVQQKQLIDAASHRFRR